MIMQHCDVIRQRPSLGPRPSSHRCKITCAKHVREEGLGRTLTMVYLIFVHVQYGKV